MDPLLDSDGRRAYFWYQYGSEMTDAETEYDYTTGKWEIKISVLGGEWVTRGLELLEEDNLSTLDGVTYDTLRDWILEGWKRYEDVLQTTWSDLSPFEAAGGKTISYHGEPDNSIPPASSVRFHESVRSTMYGDESFQKGTSSIKTGAVFSWFLVLLTTTPTPCSPAPPFRRPVLVR